VALTGSTLLKKAYPLGDGHIDISIKKMELATAPHPVKVQCSRGQATWHCLIRFRRKLMLSEIRWIAIPTGS